MRAAAGRRDVTAHAGTDQNRPLDSPRRGNELIDARGWIVQAAVVHRFHRHSQTANRLAMAVIFAPHGPLSLPWENTTVLNETLIPPHFCRPARSRNIELRPLSHAWHWRKNSRTPRRRCIRPSTACGTAPTWPGLIPRPWTCSRPAPRTSRCLPAVSCSTWDLCPMEYISSSAAGGVSADRQWRLGKRNSGR